MAINTSARTEEFELFNEQLRQLLASGYPLAEGLAGLAGEISSSRFGEAVSRVTERLRAGSPLFASLEPEKGVFSAEYVGLVRAGEQSGDMLGMIDAALDHELRLAEMELGLKKAVAYPLFVLCWTLLVFGAAMALVFPVMERIYQIAERPLPMLFRITALFYGPGGAWSLVWLVLLLGLAYWIKTRRGLASTAMRLPVMGRMMADFYSARIAHSLSLLLAARVAAHDALALIAGSMSDPTLRSRLRKASAGAREGDPLSASLGRSGIAGADFVELIELGERSGTLPAVLKAGADLFQMESQARLEAALRVVNVALITAVGGWVLFLLASLMQAYFMIPLLAL